MMKRITSQLESERAAGIVVLAAVVALAKLAHVLAPVVPAVVWALLFGVLAGHGASRSRGPAPKLPYHVPLTAGFVMMGAQMHPDVFALVGWQGVASLGLLWVFILGAFGVAAKLRLLPTRLAGLLALGLSGFGVTAIAAVGKSDRKIRGTPQTVATLVILVSGAVALASYPFIAKFIGLESTQFGMFAGLTIANNAEALATASTSSDPALLVAGAYKVLANAFEGIAVALYLWLFVPRSDGSTDKRGLKLVPRVPGFVIGFTLVGTAALLGAFNEQERQTLGALTQWAFFIALVGVGYRTRVADIFKSARPTLTGIVLWGLTAAAVLLWILHGPWSSNGT